MSSGCDDSKTTENAKKCAFDYDRAIKLGYQSQESDLCPVFEGHLSMLQKLACLSDTIGHEQEPTQNVSRMHRAHRAYPNSVSTTLR